MASFKLLIMLTLLKGHYSMDEEATCSKKPLNTKTDPLPPDNRFALEIIDVGDFYIPNRKYEVKLSAKDNPPSYFTAFTIYAKGHMVPRESNPRRFYEKDSGRLVSGEDSMAKDGCPNTVVEINVLPKTEITVTWYAPPKGNKCVTISAFVAVKPEVWYSADGPLTVNICEDLRNDEDMKPPENNNCQVCEEARYELRFEGCWSINTHPRMFPESNKSAEAAKFSDIVGASHDKNFILFKDNMEASQGLKLLAEQGNTTKVEQEILQELRTGVRTVIKASGPPKPWMSTVTSFRTSSKHHFISLVTAIIPSPDWFLGVYNMELCGRRGWTERVVLNLYPMDAGTDSGTLFDSPNEETLPPKGIGRAIIGDNKKRPFAKLIVTLVRTYANLNCMDATNAPTTREEETGGGDNNEISEPEPSETPPKYRPPVIADPNESDSDCPVTPWGDWQDCEGLCTDNRIRGYRMRSRNFLVDGEVVDFDDDSKLADLGECLEEKPTEEVEKCEIECTEETSTENAEAEAQRRISNLPNPGEHWHTGK